MTNKTRDNYFDNLRGFLILCVIIGNSLEYVNPTAVNPHFFILCLYMFHMPLFTFISGYFCKKSTRTTQAKVINIVKIYIFAEIFYLLFELIILKRDVTIDLLRPKWTLWYLFALIFWYIISDYLHNYKKAFIISILLSLIIGFDTTFGTYASSSRIVFFLPFFIGGLLFEKDAFIEKFKKYKSLISISVLVILGILYVIRDFTSVDLLFEYTNYTFFTSEPWYHFFIRIFHYIGGFLICTYMLLIFPSKKTSLSWIGKNSLILYVSHAAVIYLLTLTPILRYNNLIELIVSEIIIVSAVILITYLYTKLKSEISVLQSSCYKNHIEID